MQQNPSRFGCRQYPRPWRGTFFERKRKLRRCSDRNWISSHFNLFTCAWKLHESFTHIASVRTAKSAQIWPWAIIKRGRGHFYFVDRERKCIILLESHACNMLFQSSLDMREQKAWLMHINGICSSSMLAIINEYFMNVTENSLKVHVLESNVTLFQSCLLVKNNS